MATRKPNFPSVADFDSWSTEAEDTAIGEIVEAARVKYIVTAEKKFYGRFPDGEVVGVPLRLTLEQIEQIDQAGDAPVDQIKLLFTLTGMDAEAEAAAKRDITEMVSFASQYFKVFEKVQQATSGE